MSAIPVTSEVRKGTEASWKRKGLGEQSSGNGATSRIRTETPGPAQKRCRTLQSALIRCVIFVRPKLLSHGETVLRRRFDPVPSLSSTHDHLDPRLTLYSGERILLSTNQQHSKLTKRLNAQAGPSPALSVRALQHSVRSDLMI